MQDILVRVSHPRQRDHAANTAARLAAGLGGRLSGLHAVSAGMPPPSLYDLGMAAAEWAAQAAEQMDQTRAEGAGFVDWAMRMGVARASWIPCAGYVPDMVEYAGTWHDLVVLGVDPAGEDGWTAPGGVARIVLAARKPCLVLPPAVEADVPAGTVAVAWNGSDEAIRALHASLPLLRGIERLVILGGRAREFSPLRPRFQLEAWLEGRFDRIEFRPLDSEDATGQDILAAARSCGAELLVLGAYGRSRAAEWILGGVTREVLHRGDLPLLMHH